jgi:hypothetical protein
MAKALNRALVHGPELLLQPGKFVAGHGNVGFGTAAMFRLLFAIVSDAFSIFISSLNTGVYVG